MVANRPMTAIQCIRDQASVENLASPSVVFAAGEMAGWTQQELMVVKTLRKNLPRKH